MTTTSSAINGSSIAVTLGIGSGIDTTTLVAQLAAAEKAPREALLTTRETANTARLSSLATISSTIDSFAAALTSLVSGGTLFTQPTSSNASALGVGPVAGVRIGSALSASLQVTQLAQAQTLTSAVTDTGAPIGQGTLTLTSGASSYTITIGPDNDSLAGLAKAINGAASGVNAAIVNDGTGSRLVLKGGTGAAGAFSIAANGGAAAGLSAYTYAGTAASNGMRAAQVAQNAVMVLDGVTVTRPSNSVSDLIPGVKLTLQATTPGPVTIGASVPTTAIGQAVQDFVSAYNEMKSTLDTATAPGLNGAQAGPFSANAAIRGMVRKLAQLTSTPLVAAGSITTLADLGVSTQRDGTLAVDTNTLNQVIARNPDGVAALFNPTRSSGNPAVQIRSAMGAAAPGTYRLTDLTVGPPPGGRINGVDMIAAGTRLVAPIASGAGGLVLAVGADTPSATITIEAGLGGALKSIRDALRGGSGPLQSLSGSLATQAKQIAADRTMMETRADAYQARLSTTFGAMNGRVSVLKATQSYLAQQVKVWTNDSSS